MTPVSSACSASVPGLPAAKPAAAVVQPVMRPVGAKTVITPAPAAPAAPAGPGSVTCDRVEVTRATATMYSVNVFATAHNANIQGYRFTFDNGRQATTGPNDPSTDVIAPSRPMKVFAQVSSDAGMTPISDQCSGIIPAAGSSTAPVAPASPAVSAAPAPGAVSSPLPPTGGETETAPMPATGPVAASGGLLGVATVGWAARLYTRSRRALRQVRAGGGR
jgi:hypothetical protein